jgi:hypothetical protein
MSRIVPTPTDGAPFVRVRVALSGTTYTLEWLWNTRGNVWSFSMFKANGARMVSGVPVLLNVDLLAWVPMSLDRPPYPMVVANTSGGLDEPTLTTLGTTCKVYYLEPTS